MYKKPGKQGLYERALSLVKTYRNLDDAMLRLIYALRNDSLPYSDVREVAAKAVRVERGRRR